MKNKIFFSVFNGDIEDALNHESTVKTLETLKIDFTRVNGKYKGKTELSILVDSDNIKLIKFIASQFNQESILVVDKESFASLHFMNGKIESIGKIIKVTSNEAWRNASWSEIDGNFYIVK